MGIRGPLGFLGLMGLEFKGSGCGEVRGLGVGVQGLGFGA